jgi:Mn2+/Fe2+ NRAMP family transporter
VPSFQRLSTRVCVVFLAIAAVLILAALALDDGQMLFGAMTVLGLLPLVVVLLMLIDKHERS